MVITVIYLLGAVHGLILALVLALKKKNKLPNKLLALLMIVFSVDLGMAAFQGFGWHEIYPQFIGLDYPVTLLYGPLLYLYVKVMRDGSQQIKTIDYLHFLPFIGLLIYLIPFYTGPETSKLLLVNDLKNRPDQFSFEIINHIKVLHGLSYIPAVIYLLISYRKKLKDSFSSIEKINLNWLQHFIVGATILGGIAGGLHFFAPSQETVVMGLSSGIYDDITLLAVTVFVYGIGYMGLHQPEVFAYYHKNGQQFTRNTISTGADTQYQKSGLDKEEAEYYAEQLHRLMEQEKLYRNSDLKLADLANELDISTHNLTEVINRYIGQNFYDFVNSYRVEDVKRQLNDFESKNITLLAIGLDAGFNSKSTFNAVFKKQTGMTPSQFKNKSVMRDS